MPPDHRAGPVSADGDGSLRLDLRVPFADPVSSLAGRRGFG
jgi:hypothetical protein